MDNQEVEVLVLVVSRILFLHVVQTGPKAHQASHPMFTRALSLEVNRVGVEVDHTHLHLVPKQEKVFFFYIHTFTCLHGGLLNLLNTGPDYDFQPAN
jgi:hypothetical protein